MLIYRFFFAILMLSSVAAWAVGEHLPGERSVSWFEKPGQEQKYPKLVVAPLPDLHTEVIYARDGITFPKMKGFVVIYPGTSGHISSDFGLVRSLGPIANLLVSEGYGVLAFRQPIYNMSEDPVARLPFLERYEKLENALDWMLGTVDFARSFVPHANGRPSVPMHFISRSTGTGQGLEALHRYAKGDRRYHSFSMFESMLLMSVDGHTPEAIDKWHSAEVKEFIVDKPHTGDAPVVMACPKVFRDMSWQTEFVSEAQTRGLHLPLVYLTVGSRDEFTAPHLSLRPIIDFSRNHPGLFSALLFHDGFHNPNRAIPNVRGAGTMTRTNQLISYLLYPFDKRPVGGFHVAFTPSLEMVLAPLAKDERVRCDQLLTESRAMIPYGTILDPRIPFMDSHGHMHAEVPATTLAR